MLRPVSAAMLVRSIVVGGSTMLMLAPHCVGDAVVFTRQKNGLALPAERLFIAESIKLRSKIN